MIKFPGRRSREDRDGTPQVAARRRIRYAPITFSEGEGVRYLHFGTEWVQGAMRLARPDEIELEYAQQMMAWMLFVHAPRHIVQLGLGAAALTKFCYRHCAPARVTAVELNEQVIIAARAMFRLPEDDERLEVLCGDAYEFVSNPARRENCDVLQLDLYDASARGPVLDSLQFYEHCRASLKPPGMLTLNLFGDHPSFMHNMRNLGAAFEGRVLALPEVHEGNRVVLAFVGPPLEVNWALLYDRAKVIEATSGIKATAWVSAIKASLGKLSGTALRI